jgi:hypothetical protein
MNLYVIEMLYGAKTVQHTAEYMEYSAYNQVTRTDRSSRQVTAHEAIRR